MLGAGTVTIDPTKELMLLLFYRAKSELLLPKGRKDLGESLKEAAVRETYEESGYRCYLAPHSLATAALVPHPISNAGVLHKEPIAVQQRMKDGQRKIIFWYVAEAVSTSQWTPNTQEEGEDFETRWMPVKEAIEALAYDDDRKIATRAWEAFQPPSRSTEKARE